ncbi:MAG: PAS domain S-box protein [Candidatus Lokiarchaeota archaeon]|nr:PAS domain S-box protein [Candidatus Lokiarchaeota archaeon]
MIKMEHYEEQFSKIIDTLKKNPTGLTITQISKRIDLNRNSTAKYLDLLRVLGHTEMRSVGTAKVYFPSERIPISSFLNLTHEAIIITDNSLRIKEVNEKFLGLARKEKDDLIGKRIDRIECEIIDDPEVQMNIKKVISGENINLEKKFTLNDGYDYYFIINLIPITFDDTSPGLFMIITDITERKKAEIELKKSEKQYRLILNSIAESISVYDKDLKLVYVNPALIKWADKLGIGKIKIGRTVFENFPFLSERIKQEYEQVFKTGKSIITHEKNEFSHDIIYTETQKVPIFQDNEVIQVLTIIRDITSEKKTSMELEESEEKFRRITEQSLMGICILQDDCIKYVNEAFANVIDYTVDDVMNWKPKEYIKYIHPLDRDFVVEQARKKQEGNKDIKIHYVFRGLTKTRNTVWVDNYAKTIMYDGRPADLIMITNITDRMKAQKELEVKEKRFRNIIENTKDAIIIISLNGRLLYISPQIENILGSKKILNQVGMSLNNLKKYFHKKDFKRIIKEFWSAAKDKKVIIKDEIDFRLKHKDGDYIWISAKSKLYKEENEIVGFITSLRDITEKKKTAIRLKSSEEKYRLLTENVNDMLLILDDSFNIEYINESPPFEILGYRGKEIIGLNGMDLITKEDQEKVAKAFQKGLKYGKSKVRANLIHKDGHNVLVEASANIFIDKNGEKKAFVVARKI